MAPDRDKSALSSQSSLTFETPIGRIRVSATAEKLVEVKLGAPDLPVSHSSPEADALCLKAHDELMAFLAGELTEFTVPYRMAGTPFQRSVWKEMVRIPYGTTATYGRLSDRIGDRGAVRAVGVACGANPLPLVVPCHRVVAANGIGGFSGGLERKKWLMKLEMTGHPPAPLSTEDGGNPGMEKVESPRFEGGPSGEQQSLF